jgi:hypothetical protein
MEGILTNNKTSGHCEPYLRHYETRRYFRVEVIYEFACHPPFFRRLPPQGDAREHSQTPIKTVGAG